MGCGQTKELSPIVPPTQRRRLSVGHVDKTDAEETASDSGDATNRGLMKALTEQTVLEMLKEDGGRKFSIGSMTDQAKNSFANKATQSDGDEIDPKEIGLGYTCRKGLKPESPNQDSWMVLDQDGVFSIYGVFDGHGQKGHDVSNYVKDMLPKIIIKDARFRTETMKDMLIDSFKKVQAMIITADRMKKLDAKMSGTTCTICIHDHEENKITVAHVADSTCVIGELKKDSKALTGTPLTRDHKPNLKDERARIEKAGGRVVFDGYANHRVYAKNGRYPGLNMSRCLGDLLGHSDAGCSAEPEVCERKLSQEDSMLLLCSDGVWEFITPQEAVDIVGKNPPAMAMKSAETLAKEAWDRWIREEGGAVVDDITVVLVHLGVVGKRKP
jgi:serine/threonine protein phosphatase PrpC